MYRCDKRCFRWNDGVGRQTAFRNTEFVNLGTKPRCVEFLINADPGRMWTAASLILSSNLQGKTESVRTANHITCVPCILYIHPGSEIGFNLLDLLGVLSSRCFLMIM